MTRKHDNNPKRTSNRPAKPKALRANLPRLKRSGADPAGGNLGRPLPQARRGKGARRASKPPVGGDLGRPSAASDANAGQGVVVLGEGDSLPDEGIVVVPLKLAKGLEFDRVIIPDASARTFPESDIARRRLYTTISRATRHLTILSNGDLTELLG